jgi:hypothetical protein
MKRIGTRLQVMNGLAKQTGGGLKKKDLKYNKRGKIVSKKLSAMAIQRGGDAHDIIEYLRSNTYITMTIDSNMSNNYILKINSKLYINKTNLSMQRGLTAVVYYAIDEKINDLILRILGIIKPTNGIPALKNGGVSIDMDNLTVTIDKADDIKTTVFMGRKYVSNRIISFCIKEHIGVAYIALPFNIYIPQDQIEI